MIKQTGLLPYSIWDVGKILEKTKTEYKFDAFFVAYVVVIACLSRLLSLSQLNFHESEVGLLSYFISIGQLFCIVFIDNNLPIKAYTLIK